MTIQELEAKVDAQTTVVQSTVTLLSGISAMLKECKTMGDVTALAAKIDSNTQTLADANVAHTPAEG